MTKNNLHDMKHITLQYININSTKWFTWYNMIWVASKVYENDSKVVIEGKKVNTKTFQKWKEITCKENVHKNEGK